MIHASPVISWGLFSLCVDSSSKKLYTDTALYGFLNILILMAQEK